MKFCSIQGAGAAALLLSAFGCSEPTAPPTAEPAAEVTTTSAITGDLPVVVTSYGFLEFDPIGLRTMSAEIEGRVLELDARPGDPVHEGDPILRLQPSAVASIEIARSRRDAVAAEATAARSRRLRADGLASDADVESAETTAKDLKALADSLEGRAGSISSLKAPIAGVVDAVFVAPGDLVAPGAQLARLSPGGMQARIGVELEDAARLEVGAPVRLSGLDNAGEAIDAAVRAIDFRVNPETRMASVSVPVPAGKGLLSGEAVRAEITVEVRRNVVLTPRQSVLIDEAGSHVFVATGGRAVLRRVVTGITSGASTEIVSGVTAGERVVVGGASVLSDRMQVRVKPAIGSTKR